MPLLRQVVKGKILGSPAQTKKGGYVCNLLIGGNTDTPEVLKIHSKNINDFNPGQDGQVAIKIELQDFCFSAM